MTSKHEDKVLKTFESKNGNTYKMRFGKAGLYYYTGKELPLRLSGGFTGPKEAMRAFEIFENAEAKEKVDYTLTPLEQLDVYTKKRELLEFAEKEHLVVDEEIKNVHQLKNSLKAQLEERVG